MTVFAPFADATDMEKLAAGGPYVLAVALLVTAAVARLLFTKWQATNDRLMTAMEDAVRAAREDAKADRADHLRDMERVTSSHLREMEKRDATLLKVADALDRLSVRLERVEQAVDGHPPHRKPLPTA